MTPQTPDRSSAGAREAAEPVAGGTLRAARIGAGLTLTQFASLMGVSLSSASRWETGVHRPHIVLHRRIAVTLNRPGDEVRSWFAALPLSTEKLADPRGLRPVRQAAGLSRIQLAAAAHVSPATIAHWECGRRALPAKRWPDLASGLSMTVFEMVKAVRRNPHRAPTPPLVALRRSRGLTQQQVAVALGVSGGLVSRWERGVQLPGWPHLRRLALLLGAKVDVVARAAGRESPGTLIRSRSHTVPLGRILRDTRLWRGEPRVAVARRIGVHTETLRRWESGGTSPPDHRLGDLECALGLPTSALRR